MKRLALILAMLASAAGCTFHRDGSQAIEFNPLDWGTSTPAIRPANGPGYDNGVALVTR